MGSAHGTHVAGIAGAERNGLGMHGAVLDVDLAIAKAREGNAYSSVTCKAGSSPGQNNPQCCNPRRAETRPDTAMRNSIVDDGDGMYHSTHWYYGSQWL